jgi:quercetin dioxygenase-like cupin family protein
MAYPGKKITNSKTGQSISFIQTARETQGQLLEMESTWKPFSKEPTPHFHPRQEEEFTVLRGELTVRIDGEIKKLTAGQQVFISRNTVHSMWNSSDAHTVVNWKVVPALETEELLETATGLANDNKTNKDGVPSLLQASLLMERYKEEFRLAKPSLLMQKIVFGSLRPFAMMAGLKCYYREYID